MCEQPKPIDSFYRKKTGKQGRDARCKSCQSSERKRYNISAVRRYPKSVRLTEQGHQKMLRLCQRAGRSPAEYIDEVLEAIHQRSF